VSVLGKKLPVIGVSGSVIIDQGGLFPGYRRSYVNEDYIHAVVQNGGAPFILPVVEDEAVIANYIDTIDALILSGGHDVSPQFYDEEPELALGDIYPARDRFEFTLIELAKKKGIPILGICRGAQVINVCHGGSLWQDLAHRENTTIKHMQGHNPELVTHTVTIEEGTILQGILQEKTLRVNSFHHQLIKHPAREFVISATAADGAIEAIEHASYPFLLGIQWHPEMLHKSEPLMNRLFQQLIDYARGAEESK